MVKEGFLEALLELFQMSSGGKKGEKSERSIMCKIHDLLG